jgi:D-alanine-D-alanine ligase
VNRPAGTRKRRRAAFVRRRILVLMHETLVPPETLAGLTDKEIGPMKSEYDVTTALGRMGHEVRPLGVASDLGVLREAMDTFDPHITFNLLEEFHGVAVYDQHVVSYLELLKRRYTGCNPRGLMLAHDKALSKQVLAYHRIPVPDFVVYPMNRPFRAPRRPEFPLLVKSLTAEGSEGIAQASLVHGVDELRERTEFVHRQIATDAIAERYVDGRELYVGVLGNDRLETLPVWEMRFTRPIDGARIATARIKWDEEYQKKRGIVFGPAGDLPPAVVERIHNVCRRTYRVLNLSGYARIDLRLTADHKVYVLEANPNPDLSDDAEMARAAAIRQISYDELLDRIMQLGLRYRAQWQVG